MNIEEPLWKFIQLYWDKALDYYTQFPDKRVFWSSTQRAYIAYKKYGVFCVVLGTAIGITLEDKELCYQEFFVYMRKKRTIVTHYRVSLQDMLASIKKKRLSSIAIWEEWIIHLPNFTLNQSIYKNLRNTFNKCVRNEYRVEYIKAPYDKNIEKHIYDLSYQWLQKKRKKELWFSQWYLTPETITLYDDIAILYDKDNNMLGFCTFFIVWNVCAYDIMRYTSSITNGLIDYFLTSIILHAQNIWCQYFSLGLTPMCFSKKQKNIFSQALEFIGKTFNSIHHYQDLRHFKQKYHPERETRYFLCKKRYVIPFSLVLRQAMRVKIKHNI